MVYHKKSKGTGTRIKSQLPRDTKMENMCLFKLPTLAEDIHVTRSITKYRPSYARNFKD